MEERNLALTPIHLDTRADKRQTLGQRRIEVVSLCKYQVLRVDLFSFDVRRCECNPSHLSILLDKVKVIV